MCFCSGCFLDRSIDLAIRVFVKGPGDRSSFPGRDIPKMQKWYFMPSCLRLRIIRYGLRVNWSNPGKGVEHPSLHLGVVAIEKRAFGRPRLRSPILTLFSLWYIYIYIYNIYIYIYIQVKRNRYAWHYRKPKDEFMIEIRLWIHKRSLVSLFNGISTFWGYLMPKPSF